jgi:hypothetical protein
MLAAITGSADANHRAPHDAIRDSMKTAPDRPRKGLPPSDALERWSDPAAVAAAAEVEDAATRMSGEQGMSRHIEYQRRRSALEAALLERLRSGELLASGIAEHDDYRSVIPLPLWELFEIEYDFDEVGGNGRKYEKAEFFEPSSIPLNVREVPEWVTRCRASGVPARRSRHRTTRFQFCSQSTARR